MDKAARLFGTDGIRGRAPHFPLSADFVLRLGCLLYTSPSPRDS